MTMNCLLLGVLPISVSDATLFYATERLFQSVHNLKIFSFVPVFVSIYLLKSFHLCKLQFLYIQTLVSICANFSSLLCKLQGLRFY